MKKELILILFIVVASRAFAQSPQENSENSANSSLKLGGKVGVGAEYVDIVGTSLSLRFWLNNQTALDVIAGADGSYYVDNLYYRKDGNAQLGLGAGLRQIVANPFRNLYLDVLGRAAFIRDWYGYGYLYTDWISLTLGAGLEVFMPFCENLSVDGWLGANYMASSAGDSSFFLFSDLSPALFNLGLHFYF